MDPSKTVRLQDILKVVEDYFDIRTLHPCGGSLLKFLLHGIAGNFRQEDPVPMRLLQMQFNIEDRLIKAEVLR